MSSLKIGDVVHNAIWLTGDEPLGQKEKYKKEVSSTIDDLCEKEGFIHGPIRMYEKRPGDYGTPPVPTHIQGSKVRVLILEATLVKKLFIGNELSFINNLDRKDLVKLRKITRQRAAKDLKKIISNDDCDEIIEELGPDAAIATLRTIH